MKPIIMICLAILFDAATTMAQDTMYVHQKQSVITKIALDKIDSIVFYTKPSLTLATSISKITYNLVPNRRYIIAAIVNGFITSDGSSNIVTKGLCWSSTPNPTITSNKSINRSNGNTFRDTLIGLSVCTTIYVRTYAINNVGTVYYGDQISFTTLPLIDGISIKNTTSTSAVVVASIFSRASCPNNKIKGFCCNTISSPITTTCTTIDSSSANNFISDYQTNSFIDTITGLKVGTEYFVRAYVTDSLGTLYDWGTTLSTLPVVTTAISNITDTTVIGDVIITSNDAKIASKGLCWSTSPNPTQVSSRTLNNSVSNTFSDILTGLVPGTTYYVRGYCVVNYGGVAYGNEVSFTTNGIPSNTVTDVDGNVYHTVNIGSQIWMVENLKVTKFNNSVPIPLVTDSTWKNLTTPAYCWFNNDAQTYKSTYGAIYNWYTVNSGNLCPIGWHVPADSEWTVMGNYLNANGYSCDGFSRNAKSLCETTTWKFSSNAYAVGNIDFPAFRNKTGFNAFPGGECSGGTFGINFSNVGNMGRWWCNTAFDANFCYTRFIWYSEGIVVYEGRPKTAGCSVRCIKD